MKIKFIQKIINFFKDTTDRSLIKTQKNIKKNICCIKEKIKKGQKVKVAFLHMYATDCQNLNIFDKMLDKNSIFDPYFIINPDVKRSRENFEYNYNRSKNELIKKYGKSRVLDGYNFGTCEFIDYTNDFDIATTNNPYDVMAHVFFKIAYWAKKGIPMFYISYFYMGRCFVSIQNLQSEEFSYFWKIFVENENVLNLAKEYEKIKGKNIIVSGCPKMDGLAGIKPVKKTRKTIIIAPHHTIDDNKQSVGGFLQYCDCLLKLPKKYKNIDFVFRPHPLLFEILRNKYWGKEKTDNYLKELLSNDNVIYSTEGDYMDLFAKSDALIHDCGSFCAEYLYTGKPCAYLYKKGIDSDSIWTDFGKACIENHYIIQKESDLYKFIENVILKENDPKKIARVNFANQNIMINYPRCTDFIVNNIVETLI